MFKSTERFVAMILIAAMLIIPASALGVTEKTMELENVTVKTLGEIDFVNDHAAITDKEFDFSLKLGENWVLRGIEILDAKKNPIDFDITGIYRYRFTLPEGGATILARSEDHGTATRAECVKSLWELAGSPVVDYLMLYTDVDGDADYYEAVQFAASEKLITDGEKFRPDDPITREELAVVIYRLAEKLGLDSVNDTCVIPESVDRDSVSDWAADAVCWNITNGIMDEFSGAAGYFMPQEYLTRSELYDAISALLKLTCKDDDSVSDADEDDEDHDEIVETPENRPSKLPAIKLGKLIGKN